MIDTLSNCGSRFISEWESFRPWVYDDFDPNKPFYGRPGQERGTLTIGFGTTDPAIIRAYLGRTCTEDEAARWKREGIDRTYAAAVRRRRYNLAQHQFDALVSFTYNLGPGILDTPTTSLRQALDSGDWGQVARIQADGSVAGAIMQYVYSKGQYMRGLYNRRDREGRLFVLGHYGFPCNVAPPPWPDALFVALLAA